MKKSEIFFGALRLPGDYISGVSAFLLAYWLRPISDLIPGIQFLFNTDSLPSFKEYLNLSIFASFFLVFIFAVNNLYVIKVTEKFTKNIFKIIFLVTAWLMFIISYYFLIIHSLFFSRIALFHIWFFTILFILLTRFFIKIIQSFVLRFGIGERKVLFIGANKISDLFYNSIKKNKSYKVIGALESNVYSRKSSELKIISSFDKLEDIVKKYKVEEIIQTKPDLKEEKIVNLYNFCRNNQIKYLFIPDLIRLQQSNVEVEMIENIPLVALKESSLGAWGYIFKRIFDLLVSILLLILLSPILIITSLLIKLSSRGPIIYKSQRKHGDKVFYIYKFRSMVDGADKKKVKLMNLNERSGPMFKIKNDPRITKLGSFLRKTSIDELPQLFNVILGNMSLVGPRPHLEEEIEKYKDHHFRVFALKPGITGLAQISGRSNIDFEEEVKLDVYYIENWSLWMDIKIILKSILVVFKANGS